jgi:hypothetical protein
MSIFKVCCTDEIEKIIKNVAHQLLFFWEGGSWRMEWGGMEDVAAVVASCCAMSHPVGSLVAAGSDGHNVDVKRR